jgi:hypothetical protein
MPQGHPSIASAAIKGNASSAPAEICGEIRQRGRCLAGWMALTGLLSGMRKGL